MIEEDYVSFETAKLLKENEFNEYCMAFRSPNSVGAKGLFYSQHSIRNYEEGKTIGAAVACPTLQMAMKWLRNTFHLEIYPFHDAIQESNNWWYRIEYHSKGCSLVVDESDAIYKTYEQACEAAIKYCLENLI